MREDPYYITDERPTKTVDDVDSIPVVRLDDLPPLLPKGDVGSWNFVRVCKANVLVYQRSPVYLPFAVTSPVLHHTNLSWRREAKCQRALSQSRLAKSPHQPLNSRRWVYLIVYRPHLRRCRRSNSTRCLAKIRELVPQNPSGSHEQRRRPLCRPRRNAQQTRAIDGCLRDEVS